jgi:hypothetical protein
MMSRLRCRPTPEQELLLRAALLQGEAAAAAWEEWRARVDIDGVDAGSYRLLPLLYANLRSLGAASEPLVEKLKGIYRHTWYKNNLLLHRTAGLLRRFSETGLEVLVLKGAALLALYYDDLGLRPMTDIDILVREERAGLAASLLQGLGWRPERNFETQRRSRHNVLFLDDNGQQLDLHWHLLRECRYPGADREFWDNAVRVRIGGVESRTLGPADQLLHTCVHGYQWNNLPPMRWVADALTIIEGSAGDLDWRYLVEQVRTRGLVLPVRETLAYLRESFFAPVPETALEALWREPTSVTDRVIYAITTSPQPSFGYALVLWRYYSRANPGAGSLRRLIGFPGHIRDLWGFKHFWQLPRFALRKIRERARNRRRL